MIHEVIKLALCFAFFRLWEKTYLLLQFVHVLNQGLDLPLQAINQLFIYQIIIEVVDNIHISVHIRQVREDFTLSARTTQ